MATSTTTKTVRPTKRTTKALTPRDVAESLLADVTTKATDLAESLATTGVAGESLREAIEAAKNDAQVIAQVHGAKSWVVPLTEALAASEISALTGGARRMACGLLAEYGVPTTALAKVFGISQQAASKAAKAARAAGEAGQALMVTRADGVEQAAGKGGRASGAEAAHEPTPYALAKQAATRFDSAAARAVEAIGGVVRGEVDLTALRAEQRAEAIRHAEELATLAALYVEALREAEELASAGEEADELAA